MNPVMKSVLNSDLRPFFLVACLVFLSAVPASAGLGYSTFIHESDADNVFFNSTGLDHPNLNGHPDAIFFVTEKRQGVLNPSPIGVFYADGVWRIFNEDLSIMETARRFHVLVAAVDSNVFIHTATLANTFGAATEISHPALDGNPDAMFLITQNWEPFDVYNNANVGALYVDGNWRIFNEDLVTSMPEGASFNVAILNDEASAFLHLANSAFNCSGLNTLPPGDASVFLSHRWDAGTSLNDHPFAVDHTVFSGPNPLGVCLLDNAAMPADTQFVVFPTAIVSDGFESGDLGTWTSP